jgi:hypothetical protein
MSGWKDWQIGEVVEAGEFQSYVQNQVVQQYPDSAARGSAVATPVPGMVSYLDSTKAVEVYNGTAWGAVGQQSPNYIINGATEISQRGTAITGISADNTYSADRFYITRGGNVDYAQRNSVSSNPPAGFRNYAEIVNQTASNPFLAYIQTIETANTFPLRGQTVTLSYYARANANTTASKTLIGRVLTSTSAETKGGVTAFTQTVTLNSGTAASDWQRFSITGTIPADAQSISVQFVLGTTLAVSDGLHITGVQLEAGSVATPFRRNAPSLQAELAACQRYYIRFSGNQFGMLAPQGGSTSTTSAVCTVSFPVEMRTVPTSIEWGGSIALTQFSSNATVTALTWQDRSTNKIGSVTATTASHTTNTFSVLRQNNDSTAFLAFPAEL